MGAACTQDTTAYSRLPQPIANKRLELSHQQGACALVVEHHMQQPHIVAAERRLVNATQTRPEPSGWPHAQLAEAGTGAELRWLRSGPTVRDHR